MHVYPQHKNQPSTLLLFEIFAIKISEFFGKCYMLIENVKAVSI
jgi:hypothetical protein